VILNPDPSAMKPVRVGVIGIGNMGWHHARVLSLLRDAELIGVADPDAERGQLAIEQFGCRWFPSYTDLLQEVEAVCIAVPTLLHHRVGMACLQAGVHVLIEKPIAASQEEAADLIRAAEGSARLLQVGHIERFNPAFRELTKVVANEQVVVLEARRHSPNGDRANDVSVVLDLMIHDIDLVLELAAAPVVQLAAAGGRRGDPPTERKGRRGGAVERGHDPIIHPGRIGGDDRRGQSHGDGSSPPLSLELAGEEVVEVAADGRRRFSVPPGGRLLPCPRHAGKQLRRCRARRFVLRSQAHTDDQIDRLGRGKLGQRLERDVGCRAG
jgi:hypothetical protein